MNNFVPNETITCDDRDPPWVTTSIKRIIQQKNEAYRLYLYNNKNYNDFLIFENLQRNLYVLIESAKHKHYKNLSSKLSNPKTSPKCYWSILKSFINGKKVPCIPPLMHNNKFVTDFKGKSEIFNTFFAHQCSEIVNDSQVPSDNSKLTDKTLSTVSISTDKIAKMISNLNINKAHGHDGISSAC